MWQHMCSIDSLGFKDALLIARAKKGSKCTPEEHTILSHALKHEKAQACASKPAPFVIQPGIVKGLISMMQTVNTQAWTHTQIHIHTQIPAYVQLLSGDCLFFFYFPSFYFPVSFPFQLFPTLLPSILFPVVSLLMSLSSSYIVSCWGKEIHPVLFGSPPQVCRFV